MTLQASNLDDVEALARAVLDPAAYGYFAGGAADELTIADNRAAYARLRIVPRVLRGLGDRTTATTVLGAPLRFPAAIAPLAYQKAAHPDGELALARAAAAAGVALCLSSLANHSPEEVAAAAPEGARFFQLYPYRDRGMTDAVIARAAAAGYRALVVTVDVPAHGRREREARLGFALPPDAPLPCVPVPADHVGPVTPHDVTSWMAPDLSWTDIERLIVRTELPVALKGILSADDARIACELGVAGIVVSNHGGRQLDTAIATIDALPAIAEAVDGRCEVLVDGGVRRGTDVLKALARGARAVLVGRPITWGLAADGEPGVRTVLELLEAEIATALALAGCAAPSDAGPALVREVH